MASTTKKLHDPGEDTARDKRSRGATPPGRLGGRGDEPMSDLSARGKNETSSDGFAVNVRGDGPEVAEEVEYQIQRQTGTTAGAGKRISALGTDLGLPLDEPPHGEVKYAEREPVEGGTVGIQRKRKLEVTE